MYNKIIKISLFVLLVLSLSFIIKHYFSEKNILFINKSRSLFLTKIDNEDLLILKSDTNNIIIYKNDIEDFKKKRKKRFWEKLINNND
jgi:hypothetical protein